MNRIEIRYSYFSYKAELYLNGEKAGPYSELATTLSHPFLEAVTHIISGLDNEVFDNYEIDFYGTAFQYELLMSMTGNSEYCRMLHFHKIEALLPKEQLLKKLSFISKQHNIVVDIPPTAIVYCADDINIPLNEGFTRADIPNADVGIFENIEDIPSTVRIPILLNDSFRVGQAAGHNYYCVPKNKLGLFWEYYEMESAVLPVAAEYLTALRYANLTSIEKVELDAIKNNKEAYYMGDIPSTMDQGDSFEIEFASFPIQSFSLKSENPDILSCQNTCITACDSGVCNLLVTNDRKEIVVSKSIRIVKHQYAEEIKLIPHFEYLKRSERNRIDVIVTPYNAEDANKLIWDISDPGIIQVDENGNIIALADGSATIRVAGRNVSAAFVVKVKPILEGLRFREQSIRLKNGETIILNCDTTPSEAPTENLMWELDNKTIASINPSKNGQRCQVTASTNYEGKGNIRCYDANTKLGAVCNIEVISKVKPGTAGKIALACWLIGIIIPFLLPVSTIASIYGILCDTEPEHRARYIVCAIGSIMIMLFWLRVGMG